MKATHYIAQYQKVGNGQSFRAEVFIRNMITWLKQELSISGNLPSVMMGLVMQKGLNFSGEIKKRLKILITGFRIPT